MGRDEYLRSPGPPGVLAEFVGKSLQKLMIKAVFRLFDAEKRRRRRIFKQKKIGEDLQCPIRHLLGIEGVLKSFVIESEKQTAVAGLFGIDPFYAGNLGRNAGQNGFESPWMFTLHELDDVAKIVAVDTEMGLGTGQRQAARGRPVKSS